MAEAVEPANHFQVFSGCQVLVYRCVLACQAYQAAHLVGLLGHVKAVNQDLAAIRQEHRADDSDSSSFSGGVRAKQRQNSASLGIKVNAIKYLNDFFNPFTTIASGLLLVSLRGKDWTGFFQDYRKIASKWVRTNPGMPKGPGAALVLRLDRLYRGPPEQP